MITIYSDWFEDDLLHFDKGHSVSSYNCYNFAEREKKNRPMM